MPMRAAAGILSGHLSGHHFKHGGCRDRVLPVFTRDLRLFRGAGYRGVYCDSAEG